MTDDTTNLKASRVSKVQYYYLKSDPDSGEPITVVWGGRESCDADYLVDRESFPYMGLEFVAEGEGALDLNGKSYNLRPGTIFSYGPDMPHRICNNPKNPMVKYFVNFTGPKARELLQDTGIGLGDNVQMVVTHEVLELFNALIRDGAKANPHSDKICNAYLELLLYKISDYATVDESGQSMARETFFRCRNQIDLHYLELMSLKQMAEINHVDSSYLCRLFKKYQKLTPYQYLLTLKMNRAVELMMGSNKLVKEIAYELGYQDPYHFSRLFRSVQGLSPRQFQVMNSGRQLS
ncbi:MAG: AraC family transcriptional regulator [Planctomycetes bacterium]|nr:AraC family transcriptional regulator [Planctomycetota bacterium]